MLLRTFSIVINDIDTYSYIASYSILHLFLQNLSVELNGHVKEMCYHDQHIWILYTSGCIAVFDMKSDEILQNIELPELSNDPVTILVVDHATGLIATAYTNGLIAYLWDGSDVPISYFHSSNTVSYQNFRLTTVESCSDIDGHCQMWCGYSIGVIQIVRPPVEPSETTKILKVLRIDECSTELPPDTYITRLRFSGKSSSLMYALHDCDTAGVQVIVSCWSVGTNLKLCRIIETSITTPGKLHKTFVCVFYHKPFVFVVLWGNIFSGTFHSCNEKFHHDGDGT